VCMSWDKRNNRNDMHGATIKKNAGLFSGKHDDEEMCQVSDKCLVKWQVNVVTDSCLLWPLNVLAKKLICNIGKEKLFVFCDAGLFS